MIGKSTLALLPVLVACSGSPQVITGRLATGYPAHVSSVRAMRPNQAATFRS